jgi:hypothetical protein
MLRPRDSHDLRLLAATLEIDPAPASLRWLHDVFGNSVAVASFTEEAALLKIESRLDLSISKARNPIVQSRPMLTLIRRLRGRGHSRLAPLD